MFAKKATKIDEIFTVDLKLCSKCQIDGEDFINFYGLHRKHYFKCKAFVSQTLVLKLELCAGTNVHVSKQFFESHEYR